MPEYQMPFLPQLNCRTSSLLKLGKTAWMTPDHMNEDSSCHCLKQSLQLRIYSCEDCWTLLAGSGSMHS